MLTHPTINNWKYVGRVGNQMFQIAAVIGIADRNNTPCGFSNWNYQPYFNEQLPINTSRFENYINDKQPYYHFEDLILDKDKNYNVNGYFQSEKYFYNKKDYIKNTLFKLKQEEELKEVFKHHLHRIAIHVRRTDFVGNGCTPALSLDYYREAMEYFPDSEFLICSDDINWCENQEIFKGDKFFFVKNKHPDIFDIFLMSYCSGIIIANSSFSWWSAWAGERPGYKIIAPKAWYGGWTSKDNIPERWERIGVPFWGEEL